MKPSHLSPSALLLSVSAFMAEPVLAQESPQSPPPAADTRAKEGQQQRETPASQFAARKAKDLRARAAKAKKAGQGLVAERLEAAATIWDKVAAHQEKAAKLEADAAKIERKTLEIKSQARRAHSLVEQTETRRARAIARLRELGLSESPETPSAAPPPATPPGAPSQRGAGAGAKDTAKDSKASSESKGGAK